MGKYTVAVIDFETTGLSPHYGDRTIEVGAVLVSNNHIVDRFQSLMNPKMRVSSFIPDFPLAPLARNVLMWSNGNH
jgi:DNA polymerase-3 subunit epsilon